MSIHPCIRPLTCPSVHLPVQRGQGAMGAGGQGSRIREAEGTQWGQPAEPRTLPGSVSARSELRSFLEPSAATTTTPTPTDGFLCHAYPLRVGAPGRQRPQLALLVSDPSPRSWRGWTRCHEQGRQPPFRHSPRGRRGPRCPDGPIDAQRSRSSPIPRPSPSPASSVQAEPWVPGKAVGKAPRRPFSGLRVSHGGVLVTPGLGRGLWTKPRMT